MSPNMMPVLFVGHGSPMNAIEDNEFSRGWGTVATQLPLPSAIVCVSAHWETIDTQVTAMDRPRTIHDFFGFPQALYAIEYPAPGQPTLAKGIQSLVKATRVALDLRWGLDHGTWSVLRHMFPNAQVPTVQLSLDRTRSPQEHYDLACEFSGLRRQGVLVIGSGNMVHNLRLLNWEDMETPYDWAQEADAELKRRILAHDHGALIDHRRLGTWAALAVPTLEHYLPMLYVLALQEEGDAARFFNESVLSSLSMTSFVLAGAR
jgi:4,5-DOPA dioxygenase extradiol